MTDSIFGIKFKKALPALVLKQNEMAAKTPWPSVDNKIACTTN